MASSDGLSINAVIISVIAVSLGVVMIGTVLAPLANSTMQELTRVVDDVPVYANGASWSSLIGVVVIMTILGLVIVAVNQYTRKN